MSSDLMFTGIIQFQSRVRRIEKRRGGIALAIRKPKGLSVRRGASVAVNGICSTVARRGAHTLTFEYMPETIRKTTIAQWGAGSAVNLERPLTLSSPIDGHLLAGHVDGTGKIGGIQKEGASRTLHVKAPNELLRYIAPKGAVALDGVSLTVVKKFRGGFTTSLIPYTLTHTNLGERRAGDAVNIECDMIAKYAEELLGRMRHAGKRRYGI